MLKCVSNILYSQLMQNVFANQIKFPFSKTVKNVFGVKKF